MNKRLFFTLFISIFLLCTHALVKRTYIPYKKSSLAAKMDQISNVKARILLKGMLLGEKRGMTKKFKQQLQTLGIMHLLTPSGLHLSSAYTIFCLLSKRIASSSTLASYLLKILFLLVPLNFARFYSLKRMAVLKILGLHIKHRPFMIFIITFLIDFLFGSYSDSPLSFTFSFLFLGVILAAINNKDPFQKNHQIYLNLYLGQAIIHYFFFSPMNIVGPLFGFFLTIIFSLFFPLIFILGLLNLLIAHPITELLLIPFIQMIDFFANISSYFPTIYLSIPLFIFFLLMQTSYKKLSLIFLIIHSNSAYNLPLRSIKKGHTKNDVRKSINETTSKRTSIKRTKKGYKTQHQNGKKCTQRLYAERYNITCR